MCGIIKVAYNLSCTKNYPQRDSNSVLIVRLPEDFTTTLCAQLSLDALECYYKAAKLYLNVG